ncbi:formate acetyltransferase 1 [Sphaerochaeta pleomorpha str. Grapes]|uniref:Formate acetyltransferase n=1 Tax=Sphaerochaeta pleomorpha (strain ATCC BAA-1885 / DSM 22778 / Grapes) TaxID=158190 RepID=G8QQ85_SPHPG|nr:formate C-acetyltransferase [Sphaerochaeta pleomorpha]AEV28662.1 formate acetyltransferase 1 [Sphaerochaeta pleomorpha str. Grapes]
MSATKENGLTKEITIDTRNFIVNTYTPYDGDQSFLTEPTERTKNLWKKLSRYLDIERERGGMYGIDEHTISTITSHKNGYIDQENEVIVGLQTDEPLKRAIMPFGGIRLVQTELEAYGKEFPKDVQQVFDYRKTHNDGVFDAYTDAMKQVRHTGIITGLPDAYGRGRIIGDYRRVALYGTEALLEAKKQAKTNCVSDSMDSDTIRDREELSEQIRSIKELTAMAASYGFDISKPALDTKQAIQWLYFGYLAAIKEQNGAAMSLGRVSTFLDIYAEKDLAAGTYSESEIQEMVDHFIMKLRIVRFLRTPAYDELFSGDPTWVTESLGGMCLDGRHMVTKMSYRFLHSLTNLGPAPEPNLTVLWSERLPSTFKNYCAKLSIETSSIQYENDDLMSATYGDDYGIACCVSAMRIGKQMQFFGARVNLAKALLYAINGGKDEKSGEQVGPELASMSGEYLDFDEVMRKFEVTTEWLAKLYIDTLNVIHYMHDKYSYERIEMALHDENIVRTMAGGIAGLSVVADSLSAIKYAKVKPVYDERNIAVDFIIEGDFPKYGNDNPLVDEIAVKLVKDFITKMRKHHTYRKSIPTLSVLTITSNVVYGKKTGSTPDGRHKGEPFAPGANPMHGRDANGCVASMKSVAKIPYDYAQDGISYTFSVIPGTLGKTEEQQIENLSALLDGYFHEQGHHINVNVFDKSTLLDAMERPELYPQLTIRVSGYAVNFIKLTREQQLDVINRTFHDHL